MYKSVIFRLLAALLDFLLLTPLLWGMIYFLNPQTLNLYLAGFLLLIWFLYKPGCEYFFQATLGKKIFKLKIVDAHLKNPSFIQVLLRATIYAAPFLYSIWMSFQWMQNPLFAQIETMEQMQDFMKNTAEPWAQGFYSLLFYTNIFCLMFTRKKRALHDLFAGTWVIQDKV